MQFSTLSRRLYITRSTQLGLGTLVTFCAQAQYFDIAAGEADTVLNEFALQADIQYSINANLSREMFSMGLQGDYQPDEAFSILLADIGLSAEKQNDGSYVVNSNDQWSLEAIDVGTRFESDMSRDELGQTNVYDQDVSTEYRGKEEIERFKGSDSADLFKGMANVFSGDARNGGGIDPSIRGVQGPGRVPVIIDGTEQAITVDNGYRSASNRSFLDPSLIGGMTIHKGAQINPNVNTSVGGAVEITTLSARDIVPEGETFGMEFIGESSSNSTKPREPRLYTGQVFNTVPEYANIAPKDLIYTDPALVVYPEQKQDNNPLNGEDVAYRLAISGIKPNYEWLTAYAYRNRGNYFAGKNHSGFYNQPLDGDESQEIDNRRLFIQPEHLATVYYPGQEVPNTSSEMESILGKFAFSLSPYTKIELGGRYTQTIHGGILADRAETRYLSGLAQWPLNEVQLQAYNLKLRSQPDNPYIDFSSNLWATMSNIGSNVGSGSPNYASSATSVIKNLAHINTEEDRYGMNFSNKMRFGSDVDVTLSGRYQYHRLAPKGDLNTAIQEYGVVRAGERTEYTASTNIEWRASDSFIFNAGLRYGYYKSIDNYVKNRLAAGDTKNLQQAKPDGYALSYQLNIPITDENRDAYLSGVENTIRNQTSTRIIQLQDSLNIMPAGHPARVIIQQQLNTAIAEQNTTIDQEVAKARQHTSYIQQMTSEWKHDEQGQYSAQDNACITSAGNSNYVQGSCSVSTMESRSISNYTNTESSDGGWMPSATLTWLMTEESRSYIRYAESLRFPSMFESTVGFSAMYLPSSPLKPERSKLWEVGYIHYFDNANAKLTYFDQVIEDVMDRNTFLKTTSSANLDKMTTRGLELQLDYDNGDYFSDLSVAYNLENEVCDQSSAAQRFTSDIDDYGIAEYKECRRGGFSNTSYLAGKSPPEITGSLHIGTRLFNQKFITGARANYTEGSHSDDYVKRNDVTTLDAYIGYAYNDNFQFEVRGSNLTNIYYLEPGAITGLPAPGRTITLKLTSRF
ncbi:TonB-dependent receptor domain-containing protein [Vibrio sp.]|uniref:TonB-dependent receptor n=1 Tax=Vibrio sp. TaxID=678 RepID=UPI00311EAA1B